MLWIPLLALVLAACGSNEAEVQEPVKEETVSQEAPKEEAEPKEEAKEEAKEEVKEEAKKEKEPAAEAKRYGLPAGLADQYDGYVEALKKGDGKKLGQVNADGDTFTDIVATSAKTRGVVPGDIVAGWVSKDNKIAYFVHDMLNQKGEPLPNRLSKIAIRDGEEWKLVVTPVALTKAQLEQLGKLLLGTDVGNYVLNDAANERLANVPEDEQEVVFNQINAQSDYVFYEADNALLSLLSEMLSMPENQTVLTSYYKEYREWYAKNANALRKLATVEKDANFLEQMDPLRRGINELLTKYEKQFVDPTFG